MFQCHQGKDARCIERRNSIMSEVTHRPVLVLNKHWLVVHVCSVRRAVTLLYQGIAQVVTEDYRTYDFETWVDLSKFREEHEDQMIRTPQFQLLAPQVIVLGHYQNTPPRTVRFNRRNIFLRDSYECQYCGCKPSRDELTIDHVIPRSRGGKSTWENVVVACLRCNTRKGNRLTAECGMHPAVKPKRPSWLASLKIVPNGGNRSIWERFVDMAYWEADLRE